MLRCGLRGIATPPQHGVWTLRASAQLSSSATDLPSQAGAVIVGGGSIGASIGYHLSKQGVDTILLEKSKLTSGTTWHSAGMMWRLRPHDTDVELLAYTRDMCIQLEEETNHQSWTENGGLFIATNVERLSEYKRLHELGKYYGVESHILTASEVHDVHPLLAVDDVCGALYSPTDGTIDPTGIVNAYAAAARRMGARIVEDVGVARIDTKELSNGRREATGVTTTDGHHISSPIVVNACGAWANDLSLTAGAKLPLLAMKHAFIVTDTLEGMKPEFPNVRDHDLSIYLKTQGSAMALGGYEVNPEFHDVDSDFAFGLYDLDWDTFAQNMNGHIQRCPSIANTGIASTVCGPESFTPDHKPLVGPQPGVEGLFTAAGFNSMGMMMGGGVGRELAQWILRGSPSVDMFSVDPARFHATSVADPVWVKERTHESYAKTYAVVFPHDESLAGRGSRVSAIHEQLVEQGCIHQARHGFERPGWFEPNSNGSQVPKPYDFYGAYDNDGAWRLAPDESIAAAPWAKLKGIPGHDDHQYRSVINGELTFGWCQSHYLVAEEVMATRKGVGIIDQSYFGKFLLSGPDADEAVQFLCGADMEGRELGRVVYTPLLNEAGGVEADLTVTRLPDGSGWYFAAGGNTATKDFEWISRQCRLYNYDVTLTDHSSEMCMISVQGPHSAALLENLVTAGNGDEFDLDVFPFSTCTKMEIAGVPLWCLRLTFVGERGYELHVPSEGAPAVYSALMAAGKMYERHVGVPVQPIGYRAIDSMSAEKGYRHWHADLSNRDTPMEAGIGFTVLPKLKREGVPFLGREALEQHRAAGLQRRLVCLTVDNTDVPLHGLETIWRDGVCVGLVKSTAFGHTVGKFIAYGYADCAMHLDKITNAWLSDGVWEIGDKRTRYSATFNLRAPFDPTNARIGGQYTDEEFQTHNVTA